MIADRVAKLAPYTETARKNLKAAISSGQVRLEFHNGKPGGRVRTPEGEFFLVLSESVVNLDDRGGAGPGDGQGIMAAHNEAYAKHFENWPKINDLLAHGVPTTKDHQTNKSYFSKHGDKEYFVKEPETHGKYDGHHEAAFTEIAHLLGHGDIAPAINHHEKEKHVSMHRIIGEPGGKRYERDANYLKDLSFDDRARASLLDYVAGNPDRHDWNVMVNHQNKVQLIDHGLAFQPLDFHNPMHHSLIDDDEEKDFHDNMNSKKPINGKHVWPLLERRHHVDAILAKHGLKPDQRKDVQDRIDVVKKAYEEMGDYRHLNRVHNDMVDKKAAFKDEGEAKKVHKKRESEDFTSD
jgi:hypothetical protein